MTNSTVTAPTVTIEGKQSAAEAEILTPQALEFLAGWRATSRQNGSDCWPQQAIFVDMGAWK